MRHGCIDVNEAVRLWRVWRNWREVAVRLVRPNGMSYTFDAVAKAVQRHDRGGVAVSDELKKGDRVTITITSRRGAFVILHGRIIGEARDKHAWIVKRDDIKTPQGFHKSFCRPEAQP